MSLKGKAIGSALRYIGGKIKGNKKKFIGAAGLLLAAVAGFIGIMFPDLGLPVMTVDQASEMFSNALQAFKE